MDVILHMIYIKITFLLIKHCRFIKHSGINQEVLYVRLLLAVGIAKIVVGFQST